MHKSCSCIIPFFNEEDGIAETLEKISQISAFDSIILVDDGSNDSSLAIAKNFIEKGFYNQIQIVSYTDNRGKSAAVKEGLKKVNSEYIFLFDADLKNIKPSEINVVIKGMYEDPSIDMGIMRRIYSKWYIKLLYRELILSGQRMLKTKDLHKIFEDHFDRYQLEVAINTYMYKQQKNVVWFPFSAENSFKSQKRGFWNGIGRDLKMYRDIIKYQGLFFYLRHSFIFRPSSIDHYQKKLAFTKK